MKKHICDKEVELQKIQDDVGYIKKAISGNGEQGILSEVSKNTKFRHQAMASISLIKWMIGISTGSLIIGIFNLFNGWIKLK